MRSFVTLLLVAGCPSPDVPTKPDPEPDTEVADTVVDTDPVADPTETAAPEVAAEAPWITPHLVGPETATLSCDGEGDPTWFVDGVEAGGGVLTGPWPVGTELRCEIDDASRSVVVHNGATGSNVLFVLLDDVGIDRLSAWSHGAPAPETPTLDALGLRFRNVYVSPVCTPTRSAVITGRHPMNNGQGTAIRTDGMGLPFEAYTLPEMLHEHGLAPWTTAAVGKWHIAGRGRGADNPLTHGFDRFAGTMGNIMPGTGEDYYGWRRLEDLESVWTTTYATTDAADTAIRYMAEMPEPWFVWLAFHAVHSPWQMPPDDLHDTSFTDASPTADRYDAMLIALDRELGRTLDALTPEVRARTTVIVLGDNGTPEFAVRPPLDPLMAKGTVYEGGVHVPMIVQGPMVEQPGRWVEGIVSQVDLFPTVAELGGIDLPRDVWDELDGKSLMPMLARPGAVVREHAYSEYFSPNGRDAASRDVWARSVRDERWRFVRRLQGREELYDLADGPAEGVDLAASITDPSQTLPGEAGEALERMRALLDSYEPRP